MKILVFDTETNGLPVGKNPSFYDCEKWPYIVQMSYILFDTELNKILTEHDWIIKVPDIVEIKNDHIHGISKQKSNIEGIDIKYALEYFDICLNNCDMIVGHNIQFDKKMIIIENIRLGRTSAFKFIKPQQYCTMINGTKICNLQIENKKNSNSSHLKYPTQSELHYNLFNTLPKGVHNSFIDILICMRCFYKMNFGIDLCDVNLYFKNKFKSISL